MGRQCSTRQLTVMSKNSSILRRAITHPTDAVRRTYISILFMCCVLYQSYYTWYCADVDPRSVNGRIVGGTVSSPTSRVRWTTNWCSGPLWREYSATNEGIVMTIRCPAGPTAPSGAVMQIKICNETTNDFRLWYGNMLGNFRIGRDSWLGTRVLYARHGGADPFSRFRYHRPDIELLVRGSFDPVGTRGSLLGRSYEVLAPETCLLFEFGLREPLAMRRPGIYELAVSWDSWPECPFPMSLPDSTNIKILTTGIVYQIAR